MKLLTIVPLFFLLVMSQHVVTADYISDPSGLSRLHKYVGASAGRYNPRRDQSRRDGSLKGNAHPNFGHTSTDITDHRDIHLGHELGHIPGSRYHQRAAEGAGRPSWPRPGQLASTHEHHWGKSRTHRAALRGGRKTRLGGYTGNRGGH